MTSGFARNCIDDRGAFSRRHSLLLLIGAVEDSDSEAASLFSQFPWPTSRVSCLRNARRLLERDLVRVIVCERGLADGTWRDVLDLAAWRPHPPPVIVTSRLADEYLWAEVLNLGGYDVLAKPLDRDEARRVIGLAWDRLEDRKEFPRPAGRAQPAIHDSYIDEIEGAVAFGDLATCGGGRAR